MLPPVECGVLAGAGECRQGAGDNGVLGGGPWASRLVPAADGDQATVDTGGGSPGQGEVRLTM